VKKLFYNLTTLGFLVGQLCVAQRKPFVFTPDKEWHYATAGVGFPLPSYLGYEYRLNRWGYAFEMGMIHTSLMVGLASSGGTTTRAAYIRDNLQQGSSFTAGCRFHFTEKSTTFYIGSQLRYLKVGIEKDNPRGMISVFAPDRLSEIETQLDNNFLLNQLLGGSRFLDEATMKPALWLMMMGLQFGRKIQLSQRLILEPQLSFDVKVGQSVRIDFNSNNARVDRVLDSQISPILTSAIQNQRFLPVLPALSVSVKYVLRGR